MARFYTDSVTLAYADVDAAKRWWVDTFDCKVVRVPADWDCSLPSDVALQLPSHDGPTILLNSKVEVEQAGFDRPSPVASVIFCNNLKKGHDHLVKNPPLLSDDKSSYVILRPRSCSGLAAVIFQLMQSVTVQNGKGSSR